MWYGLKMTKTNATCKNKGETMNTLFKFKYMAAGLLAAVALLLQSCSKDEAFDVTGSSENIVYLNTQSFAPVDAPKNSFLFLVSTTPTSSTITYPLRGVTTIAVKFPVQCSQVAAEDVRVKFELDNSLVVEGYSALPGGLSATMDKTELVIPKGANMSTDSITVSVDGDWKILKGGAYMLPVKISSISGNVQMSSNLSTAYVLIKSTYTNSINNGTTLPSGAAITPKSTWTAIGINDSERLFDASTSTSSYASTGNLTDRLPLTVEIDMKTDYEAITGFRVAYSNQSYCMTRAIVYTKTDAGDYEFQGDVTLTRATSQVVRFYQPVNARFIKLEVQTVYNTANGLRITDFNAYR
jgi:hypothetical protein